MFVIRTYSLPPMPSGSPSKQLSSLLALPLASAFHGWKILGSGEMVARHDISELCLLQGKGGQGGVTGRKTGL